ncbi:MAG: hypothetical protein ABI811_04370 [Acidobacteriota bacterium]
MAQQDHFGRRSGAAEVVADISHLLKSKKQVNASCPGETSVSFITKLADVYNAFSFAAAAAGEDPCDAGLLVRFNATTCDIHPSAAGKRVMAAAVLLAAGSKK